MSRIGQPRYVRTPGDVAADDLLVWNGTTWEAKSVSAALGAVTWLTSGITGTNGKVAAFHPITGVAIELSLGVDIMIHDAGLTSLTTADAAAGIPYVSAANTWTSRTGAAGDIPYFTSASALGVIASSANGRSLIAAANYAAMLTALGGQPVDATLTAWSGAGAQGLAYFSAVDTVSTLTLAANKGIYATGAGTLATFDLSSFARTFLDDADAATMRTTLGLDLSGDYGDGSDGPVALNGTNTFAGFATTTGSAPNLSYTLTRDLYATTLTISSGIKVRTAGFVVHASGLVTNAGQLHNDGDSASGATAGANTGAEGTLQSTRAGGGNGGTTVGAATSNGTNGTGSGGRNVTGSASGAGGGAGLATGGTGGTAAAPSASQGSIRSRSFNSRARLADNTAANGGNGGGGGGGTSVTGTSAGGGGGAAGGGVKLVFYGYDGTGGVLSADGGNGANGASTGDGQAGGGGGGCGGFVHVHVRHLTAWGTVRANGGAFGNGSNGGANGAAGGAGVVVQLVGA